MKEPGKTAAGSNELLLCEDTATNSMGKRLRKLPKNVVEAAGIWKRYCISNAPAVNVRLRINESHKNLI